MNTTEQKNEEMKMNAAKLSEIEMVSNYVTRNGPIKTVRVSSAQARGAAKKYAYWGAARYEIRRTKAGHLSNIAEERANSDRRSEKLAEFDAEQIELLEDRIYVGAIGEVMPPTARRLVRLLGLSVDCDAYPQGVRCVRA